MPECSNIRLHVHCVSVPGKWVGRKQLNQPFHSRTVESPVTWSGEKLRQRCLSLCPASPCAGLLSLLSPLLGSENVCSNYSPGSAAPVFVRLSQSSRAHGVSV